MSGVISYTIPNAHSGSIYSLKLLPSGYVASGGSDGYIKQWNMETYTYSFVTDMYFPGMTYLTMDVDSSGFIYSGANNEVIIVNPTNQAVQNFGSPFSPIYCLRLLPGDYYAIVGYSPTLYIYNGVTPIASLNVFGNYPVYSCALYNSGQVLVVGATSNEIYLINVASPTSPYVISSGSIAPYSSLLSCESMRK